MFLFFCGGGVVAKTAADVHDPAGLRIPRRGQVLAGVLRRPQEGGHGEPEAAVLPDEPVLPTAFVWDAWGEREVLRGAQGKKLI